MTIYKRISALEYATERTSVVMPTPQSCLKHRDEMNLARIKVRGFAVGRFLSIASTRRHERVDVGRLCQDGFGKPKE